MKHRKKLSGSVIYILDPGMQSEKEWFQWQNEKYPEICFVVQKSKTKQ